MPQRRVTIATATGLHARPASLVTSMAATSGHGITIGREGQPPVDASSIIMVMSLGLQHGEDVVLSSDSEAADETLVEIADLLATDLDAETAAQ